MIIELGDLRCAVSEIFPGLHDGCLVKKTGRQRIKIQNVRIRRNMKGLVHWFILAQELNQIKDCIEKLKRAKKKKRKDRGERRNDVKKIQADWEQSSREGGRNRRRCWSGGACLWCHSNSIQLLIQTSTQEPLNYSLIRCSICTLHKVNAPRTKTNNTTKIVYIWAFSIRPGRSVFKPVCSLHRDTFPPWPPCRGQVHCNKLLRRW